MSKSYSELIRIDDYKDRFDYLRLAGFVGEDTFGFDRYLNQLLYQSQEWRKFRRTILLRDDGLDLAHKDHPISGIIIVHHINPLTIEDVQNMSPAVFDLDNVVCVSRITHNAIHYGDEKLISSGYTERQMNDTCPWRN